MKRPIILVLLISCLLTMTNQFASAKNETAKTVPLKMEKYEETRLPPDRHGRRAPSAPVICTIDPTGISIAGIDTTSISLYEVYDADGELLAAYSTEADFISYIFQIQEEVEIRFHTADAILSGWLLP